MDVVWHPSVGVMFALALGLGVATANAQQAAAPAAAGKTLTDGVYTDAQADKAKPVFSDNCASCHGASLGGGDFGPALTGAAFATQWNGKTLADVFEFMSTQMPLSQPGSLSDGQYANLLALVLRANKFPAGDTELKPDPQALAQIAMPTK